MDLFTDLQEKVADALAKKAALDVARTEERDAIDAASAAYAKAETAAKQATAEAEGAYTVAANAVRALQMDVQSVFNSVLPGGGRDR